MKKRPHLTILQGDNRETLFQLRPESIQCVVTSPPYWSVRDYNTPPVEFPEMKFCPMVGLPPITVPAWTGQLGLEPEPWMFIGHTLLTMRAVARVLRPDGTLWVNFGDTYYTGDGTSGANMKRGPRKITHATTPNRLPIAGYKPKDLVGIPWMFAKAMQAEGWWLRGDVIWHKPNPMPTSQRDRPTTAHEYLFLFSRSEHYFYDNHAVKEAAESNQGGTPSGWDTGAGAHTKLGGRYPNGNGGDKPKARAQRAAREKRSVWTIASKPYDGAHFATFPPDLVRPCVRAGTSAKGACPECGAPWLRLTREIERPAPGTEAPPPPRVEPDMLGHVPPPPAVPTVLDTETTGWRPTCVCGSDPALELRHDDFEEFETPTGEQLGEDVSIQKGGRGRDRETLNSGKRLLTRYEHRHYARQLLASPHRKTMESETAEQCGKSAFEHYTRTDASGARPIPPALLERWLAAGYLQRVELPTWEFPTPVRCRVLDPFGGSGTTAGVAIEEGCEAVVCEIAAHYWPLIENRAGAVTPPLLTT